MPGWRRRRRGRGRDEQLFDRHSVRDRDEHGRRRAGIVARSGHRVPHLPPQQSRDEGAHREDDREEHLTRVTAGRYVEQHEEPQRPVAVQDQPAGITSTLGRDELQAQQEERERPRDDQGWIGSKRGHDRVSALGVARSTRGCQPASAACFEAGKGLGHSGAGRVPLNAGSGARGIRGGLGRLRCAVFGGSTNTTA